MKKQQTPFHIEVAVDRTRDKMAMSFILTEYGLDALTTNCGITIQTTSRHRISHLLIGPSLSRTKIRGGLGDGNRHARRQQR